MAFDYLIRTFPFAPPIPGYLEPRLVLVSQLYALVHDRTAVDVEVSARRRAGSVRVMKVTALGLDEHALVRTEEYREIVQSVIDDKQRQLDALAVTAPAHSADDAAVSLFAPTARPIKRKRGGANTAIGGKRQGAGDATPAAFAASTSAESALPPLSIPLSSSARERPPPLSPLSSHNQPVSLPVPAPLSSSASASSSVHDKENLSSLLPYKRPPSAAVLSDEVLLLSTLLSSLVPHYHEPTITRAQLLAYLHDGLPYASFTGDDVISALMHEQLLLASSSLSSTAHTYVLALPHIGHVVREVLEARREIARLVRKTRYGEMRKSDLERRVRLKGSERGVQWHMLDMIGAGHLLEVDTTRGTVLRLPRDETRRR